MGAFPVLFSYSQQRVGELRAVNYSEVERVALFWQKKFKIKPFFQDETKIVLLIIDAQATFCMPSLNELYVEGAAEDCLRIAKFIYKNIDVITEIAPTLDTHLTYQIFYPLFWVNDRGEHPIKNQTVISYDDVKKGVWKVNPSVADIVANGDYDWLQKYALHYTQKLTEGGRYSLVIWNYHGMTGSVGHALIPILDEASFFHSVARGNERIFQIKGNNPLTENYSVFKSEISTSHDSQVISQQNSVLMNKLMANDIVIIAGEAGDYCVAWSIDDLLTEILAKDPSLAKKVYILKDAISPVVIPGIYNGTAKMESAFSRFEAAGMHLVKTTDRIESWPNIKITKNKQ